MSKPDDRYIPGSERAYDQVNDRLWRDIVSDRTRRGLPSVDPSSQAPPRIDEPPPTALKPPSGVNLIDKMCAAADQQDRLARITEMARTVAALQANDDARIARLQGEIVRLEAELKKAGK
jgi:uncharacterized small protein (DUF1192 family)